MGQILEKLQNKISNQLVFKPVFLKIQLGDFSGIFGQGIYMLYDLFKFKMPFSRFLWTQFSITMKTVLFMLSFDTKKLHSQFSRKRSYRFFLNFAIVKATMSSKRSRRRISIIVPDGKLFGFM